MTSVGAGAPLLLMMILFGVLVRQHAVYGDEDKLQLQAFKVPKFDNRISEKVLGFLARVFWGWHVVVLIWSDSSYAQYANSLCSFLNVNDTLSYSFVTSNDSAYSFYYSHTMFNEVTSRTIALTSTDSSRLFLVSFKWAEFDGAPLSVAVVNTISDRPELGATFDHLITKDIGDAPFALFDLSNMNISWFPVSNSTYSAGHQGALTLWQNVSLPALLLNGLVPSLIKVGHSIRNWNAARFEFNLTQLRNDLIVTTKVPGHSHSIGVGSASFTTQRRQISHEVLSKPSASGFGLPEEGRSPMIVSPGRLDGSPGRLLSMRTSNGRYDGLSAQVGRYDRQPGQGRLPMEISPVRHDGQSRQAGRYDGQPGQGRSPMKTLPVRHDGQSGQAGRYDGQPGKGWLRIKTPSDRHDELPGPVRLAMSASRGRHDGQPGQRLISRASPDQYGGRIGPTPPVRNLGQGGVDFAHHFAFTPRGLPHRRLSQVSVSPFGFTDAHTPPVTHSLQSSINVQDVFPSVSALSAGNTDKRLQILVLKRKSDSTWEKTAGSGATPAGDGYPSPTAVRSHPFVQDNEPRNQPREIMGRADWNNAPP